MSGYLDFTSDSSAFTHIKKTYSINGRSYNYEQLLTRRGS